MAKFTYNNTKNASTSHTLFKLNCEYYLYVFFEDNVNFCPKSHTAEELVKNLKDLISIC